MNVLLMKNGKDVVMIKYDSGVDYRELIMEVKRLMKYGLKFDNVVDLETGEILEHEIDKILML